MLLAALVDTSERVARTRGRLEKSERLAECLRRLAPHEVEIGVGYLSGEVPGGRIHAGPALLRESRPAAAAGEPSLELADVQRELRAVAGASGAGSRTEKARRLGALLARATASEQSFLLRLVLGELRQGALESVLIDAVAQAAGVPKAQVRRAAMLAGSATAVATAALARGAEGLAGFRIELLRPIQPMLAQPAGDVEDALATLGRAGLELKLDGARVQVHKAGDEVRVFTRRLNDVTAAVPEVVAACRALPARELVLDGETIALRPDGRPHPFQVTMRRFGRKLDVDAMRSELPLDVFFFDLLYADGAERIDAAADERFRELAQRLPAELVVPRLVTDDLARARRFLGDAVAGGHEGVMAKALEASYVAGSRGKSWLKVKPAHTLDLVVLAAEWGHGRRKGWLSNLHLGALDPARGGFVMLGKTFKGLSDETLAWQTERLLALEIGRDAHTVHVRPELVVEIAVNELQASPHYPAGLALRFARVKRYRTDKRPEDADTIDTVRAIRAGAGESP